MAQLFRILAYQFNSQDVPLVDVFGITLPSAGVKVRDINQVSATPLSTGIYCYSTITTIADGQTYSTTQTAAQIATLANA